MNFKVKVGDTFSITDLDQKKLESHTEKEYIKFIPCKNGRSDELVKKHTRWGLAAEHYMIEKHEYININEKYQDIKNPSNNEKVEIKTKTIRAGESGIAEMIEETRKKKLRYKNNAEWIIMFQRDIDDYECHSFWKWHYHYEDFRRI